MTSSPFRYLSEAIRGPREEELIWALRDVAMEVQQGEIVGVIGRNGAGKSTLLKILSRVTEPTTGSADLYGRVASLLEIGTGFHPDLTGRENIFMNGALLGMHPKEIRDRFDEIVAFSGIEKFINTPVKRYSSGMYVRLAFAVAAHLEAEILLVDEVLAVGDAMFQKKCLGRMAEVARSGRTVLFVSHSMPAVLSLCSRTILFEEGRLAVSGPTDRVISTYLSSDTSGSGEIVLPDNREVSVGTHEAVLRQVAMRNSKGEIASSIFLGQPFEVVMIFEARKPIADAAVEIGISTNLGLRIATATSLDQDKKVLTLLPGAWRIAVGFELTLLPGEYFVDVMIHHWLESKLTIDWVERVLAFTALDVSETGKDHYVRFSTNYRLTDVRGFIRPTSHWREPVPVLAPGKP